MQLIKKYILTSPKFEGQIIFGFNADKQLVVYDGSAASFDFAQFNWLLNHLPINEQGLDYLNSKIDGRIELMPEDLTFERFWNTYERKHNRKRAEPLFNKLNDGDKMQAIIKIKSYQQYCYARHRGIADPEKYLRDRFFDTEWSKLS